MTEPEIDQGDSAAARVDPVFRHARFEAIFIAALWALCTAYCCGYSYLYGYIRPGRELGRADIQPILGMPSWVFWGIFIPWIVCGAINIAFCVFLVKEDDLGADHAGDLDAQIREGAGEAPDA